MAFGNEGWEIYAVIMCVVLLGGTICVVASSGWLIAVGVVVLLFGLLACAVTRVGKMMIARVLEFVIGPFFPGK
jgi:hypothetical protein